jgi:pimeloyl-ACP methyl ester carboxylesterase
MDAAGRPGPNGSPDSAGYGGSARLGEGPEAFDKSRLAAHLVELMASLGHDHFAVVGHDRGALVAFRAALDHPDVVTHLGVLDVIPTVDNRYPREARPECS